LQRIIRKSFITEVKPEWGAGKEMGSRKFIPKKKKKTVCVNKEILNDTVCPGN